MFIAYNSFQFQRCEVVEEKKHLFNKSVVTNLQEKKYHRTKLLIKVAEMKS